jgi:hypothetical protein
MRFFCCARKNLHATSIWGLTNILRECGLTVRVSIPWYFLLWPAWWRFAGSFIDKDGICREFFVREEKAALISCLDAQDIYGIAELWAHVVVDFRDEYGTKMYVDAYRTRLVEDFPGIDPRESTVEERLAMVGPKLLVTKTAGVRSAERGG